MTSISHVQRVRILYKYILRLHRGLPVEMRAIGDSYVKDEFRRHKDVEMDVANRFLNEWTDYCVTLTKQLSERKQFQDVGQSIPKNMVEVFSDEQLGQLSQLFQEATKPRDSSNPMGFNPQKSDGS